MSEKSGKLRIKKRHCRSAVFVWIVRSLFVTFNIDDVQIRADILEVLFGGDYRHDVEDSVAEEGDPQESHEQLSGVKHQHESEDTREYREGDYQPPSLVAQPSGLDRSLELGGSVCEHVDSGGKADYRHGAAGVRQEDYAEGDEHDSESEIRPERYPERIAGEIREQPGAAEYQHGNTEDDPDDFSEKSRNDDQQDPERTHERGNNKTAVFCSFCN